MDYWFDDFLKSVKLDSEIQQILLEVIKEKLIGDNFGSLIGTKHYQKINELEDKLVKIQDMFIDDKLDKAAYEQPKKRCEDKLKELKDKEQVTTNKKEVYNAYKATFNRLSQLGTI